MKISAVGNDIFDKYSDITKTYKIPMFYFYVKLSKNV